MSVVEGENLARASNPNQAWATRFDRDGVAVRPQGLDGDLTLRLAAWGFEGQLLEAIPATVFADGERVELRRGSLVEWFVNRPSGLEQGFTVTEAPPGEGDRLRFEMVAAGPLLPSLRADGAAIEMLDAEGTTRLSYGGLLAFDATGRDLEAQFAVLGERIAIGVDAAGAVYPVTIDPTIVNERAKLLAADGAFDDLFGWSVAVSGTTVVVGAYGDDDQGPTSGSAYVFERPAGGWDGTHLDSAKLLASDGAAGNQFGYTVAISGTTVVVGAPYLDDARGADSGSAYVFEKPVGGWAGSLVESAKLLASDGAAGDQFGYSVSISGTTAVVGAYLDDDRGDDSGSAYVFEKPVGGWAGTVQESAKLLASDAALSELFGYSVSISGTSAVVGAILFNASLNFGSAYVFEKPAGGWIGIVEESAKLLASDAPAFTYTGFGSAVAISGTTAVVGAFFDEAQSITDSGSVYVFERPSGGWSGTLVQSAKLFASDAAVEDYLGISVAISGTTVLAGTYFDDDNGVSSGSAYVFEKPAGGWPPTLLESSKLLASDGAVADQLGFSVAVSGTTKVAGAILGGATGSAYVFDVAVSSCEADARALANYIASLPLSRFLNGFQNIKNALVLSANLAASSLQNPAIPGQLRAATSHLNNLLGRVDGQPSPNDWMYGTGTPNEVMTRVLALLDRIKAGNC